MLIRPRLSETFKTALRTQGKPLYQVGREAGLTPSQIYRMTSGIDEPKIMDERVWKLCRYLGFKLRDAFEWESDTEDRHE